MTFADATFAEWAQRVSAAEELSYWTGPRPLSDPRRSSELVGREEDAHRFSELVRRTSLVVLHGESGVGKTSMLKLGIAPRLEEDGFLVLICRRWASSRSSHDLPDSIEAVEAFIAEALDGQLPSDIESGPGFVARLDDEYGEEAVIVLDQFESLIRHQPRFYDAVKRWVEHVVRNYDVRIVISLRTEFKYRIDDLKAGPYQRADFRLGRISSPEVIGRIIREGSRRDGSTEGIIDEAAAKRITERWVAAGGGTAWTRVGLLHLQALLYVLWRTLDTGTSTVTEAALEDLEVDLEASDDAEALFSNALARAVSLRLDTCRDVYLGLGGDTTLAQGVESLLTRIPIHMESGGYKVSQESRQLAAKVLARELETLRIDIAFDTGTAVGDIFSAFAEAVRSRSEWLTVDRLALVDDTVRPLLQDTADDQEVTSGPMLGMPPLAVLTEELRRYFFALAWLELSDIIAPADADGGETMLELVHDGFSRGLREWASAHADDPERALHRLTASVGEVFDWRAHTKQMSRSGGLSEARPAISANLRWRSCRVIGTEFRRQVFVNCDFRETTFVDCVFEGVTFINCLLDGVTFTDCIIRGETDDPAVGAPDFDSAEAIEEAQRKKSLRPSFLIEDAITARMLNSYRDTSRRIPEATELVSWTAGLPARPISARLAGVARPEIRGGGPAGADSADKLANFRFVGWTDQHGGLTFYGGRLSSLMFADCVLDGTVSLRHVAGTSLEFGGLTAGSIELFDVAIRGLSVSPPVGSRVTESADEQRTSALRIDVDDSILQNVWFSTPLHGRAEIHNSVIWQLFSASDQSDFVVRLDDTSHLGVFNVPEENRETAPAADPVDYQPGGKYYPVVPLVAKRLDYQSLANLLKNSPPLPEE